MNGRLIFYCLAVVALVLIFAAAPAHATERRDPVLNPDATQSSGSAHRGEAVAHPASRSTHAKKTAPAAKTAHSQTANSTLEAKEKPAGKKSASDGQAGSSSGTK